MKTREVLPKTECDEVAGSLIASMQGAILLSKTERNASRLGGWTAAGSTKVHALYRLGQTAEPTREQARSMTLV
jgi:hypothetical protein